MKGSTIGILVAATILLITGLEYRRRNQSYATVPVAPVPVVSTPIAQVPVAPVPVAQIQQPIVSSTIPPEIDPDKYDLPIDMVGKSGNQVTYQPTSAALVSVMLGIPLPSGIRTVAKLITVPTSSKQMIPWSIYGGPDNNTSGTLIVLPYPPASSGFMSLPSRPMWRGIWSKK